MRVFTCSVDLCIYVYIPRAFETLSDEARPTTKRNELHIYSDILVYLDCIFETQD